MVINRQTIRNQIIKILDIVYRLLQIMEVSRPLIFKVLEAANSQFKKAGIQKSKVNFTEEEIPRISKIPILAAEIFRKKTTAILEILVTIPNHLITSTGLGLLKGQ